MAVLFGSTARGHVGEDSDVDVLVSLAEERPMYLFYLAARLTRALGRDVDVLSLAHVRAHDPALLGAITRDGRPLVDRDGSWPGLIAERRGIERAAAQARADRHRRATHAIAQLTGAWVGRELGDSPPRRADQQCEDPLGERNEARRSGRSPAVRPWCEPRRSAD
jgi:predicted nucleotidyltransferase